MTRIQCAATTTRGTEPISAAATERGRATPAAIPTGLAARAAPDIRDKTSRHPIRMPGTVFYLQFASWSSAQIQGFLHLGDDVGTDVAGGVGALGAQVGGDRKFSHSNRGESKPAPSVRPPPASSFSITSEA